MNVKVTKQYIKPEYPCLMFSKYYNVIVLFSENASGTALTANEKYHIFVGYKSSTWDMSDFEIFNGILELSN